jgi:hypothetical protein
MQAEARAEKSAERFFVALSFVHGSFVRRSSFYLFGQ